MDKSSSQSQGQAFEAGSEDVRLYAGDEGVRSCVASEESGDGMTDQTEDAEYSRARGDPSPCEVPTQCMSAPKEEIVRLLDQELEELNRLLELQRRKVDALERLRWQWLSGQRALPDVPFQSGEDLPARDVVAAPAVVVHKSVDAADGVHISGAGGDWERRPPAQVFEHFMIPHARFSIRSPVIAMKTLSIRLKGKNRPSKSTVKQSSSARPGVLTVFALMHADGVVRLLDADGEEAIAFASDADSDGSPPRTADAFATRRAGAVGLAVDASEGNPVIVTAGADGAARVFALKIYSHGRRVAGGGHDLAHARDADRRSSTGADGSDSALGRSSVHDERSADATIAGDILGPSEGRRGVETLDGPANKPPPTLATSSGLSIIAELSACLGETCGEASPNTDAASASESGAVEMSETHDGAASAAADTARETMGSITSLDVFFHRTMATTVVAVGYSAGGVRFYSGRGGTVLGSANADRAVLAVKRSGQSIAYSDGHLVRFASVGKLEETPYRVCSGDSEMTVSALAFDIVSVGTLYVGYENGAVVAFNSRLHQADDSFRCLPSYTLAAPKRLPPMSPAVATPSDGVSASSWKAGRDHDASGRCDDIAVVRGYTIISQGPLLSVYNTTADGHLLLNRLSEGGDCEEFGSAHGSPGAQHVGPVERKPVSSWHVMSSSSTGEAHVGVLVRCGMEMSVYKASLPYKRQGPDMTWLRVPILLLGLFVVAMTQVATRKRSRNDTSSGPKSSTRRWRALDEGNDDVFNDRDLGFDPDVRSVEERLNDRARRRAWDMPRSDPRERSSRRGGSSLDRYDDTWDRGGPN